MALQAEAIAAALFRNVSKGSKMRKIMLVTPIVARECLVDLV
jgi:hypothetical protein